MHKHLIQSKWIKKNNLLLQKTKVVRQNPFQNPSYSKITGSAGPATPRVIAQKCNPKTQNYGAALDKSAQLRKKRIKKDKSMRLANRLVALNSELMKSYSSTFGCCQKLEKTGSQITSRYCGQRWCFVCQSIKTARLIEGYSPVLAEFGEDLRFVTLSRRNVAGEDLKSEINNLIKDWQKLKAQLRNEKIPFLGIRTIEITYNDKPKSKWYGTFHPHFHFVIVYDWVAELVKKKWLKMNKHKASHKCQLIKALDQYPTPEENLRELFKYSTKLEDYPAEKLDIIFHALRNRRTVQSFGLKKDIHEDELLEELEATEYEGLPPGDDTFLWNESVNDWVSMKEGYLLCEMLNQKSLEF